MPVVTPPPLAQQQHIRNIYGPIAVGTTGTVGAHTLFTVTGTILLRAFTVATTVDLTNGGSATLDFGVVGRTQAFVFPTVAYTEFVTTKILGTAGTTTGGTTITNVVIGGLYVISNIILTIGGAAVTGGTLVIDAYWDAVSDNGALA